MKKTVLLLLGASMVFLTSCIETLEEIYLNKDGSGKYSITFDMSEIFNNPMMKGILEEAAQEEGVDSSFALGEVDTMMMLGEGADANEVMSKVALHMTMSDSLGKFIMNMSFPFDEVGEIASFYETLNEEGSSAANGMASQGSFLMPGGLFKLNRRTLSRQEAPKTGENEMFAGEDGDFVKMFFASGTYTTVYHLPGKVKKASIEGAVVEGKTVTVERPLLDMMEGKSSMAGEIKFKRN